VWPRAGGQQFAGGGGAGAAVEAARAAAAGMGGCQREGMRVRELRGGVGGAEEVVGAEAGVHGGGTMKRGAAAAVGREGRLGGGRSGGSHGAMNPRGLSGGGWWPPGRSPVTLTLVAGWKRRGGGRFRVGAFNPDAWHDCINTLGLGGSAGGCMVGYGCLATLPGWGPFCTWIPSAVGRILDAALDPGSGGPRSEYVGAGAGDRGGLGRGRGRAWGRCANAGGQQGDKGGVGGDGQAGSGRGEGGSRRVTGTGGGRDGGRSWDGAGRGH